MITCTVARRTSQYLWEISFWSWCKVSDCTVHVNIIAFKYWQPLHEINSWLLAYQLLCTVFMYTPMKTYFKGKPWYKTNIMHIHVWVCPKDVMFIALLFSSRHLGSPSKKNTMYIPCAATDNPCLPIHVPLMKFNVLLGNSWLLILMTSRLDRTMINQMKKKSQRKKTQPS